jgi:hypothetical protein
MPPKKGGTTKASGGLTLTRGIGPQDIKLLNKLTSDSVGVGISTIGLTSSQFVELGRFDFSSWEDLVKKTGVTPETLKLIQETFRRHLVSTEADGWVEKPSTSTAAAAAASEGPPSIATESDNSKRASALRHYLCLRPMRCSSTYSSRRRRRRSNTA